MISVIIPVHNRPLELRRAVDSVLSQSYRDFELIVVDDGSTVDTSAVREMIEAAGQRYLRTANRGVSAARNTGIAAARGEWLALLDSDDRWLPQKLERQVAFHHAHPEYAISQTEEIWYRHGRRVNKRKAHLQPEGEAFFRSLALCCISSSSVMLRREVLPPAPCYDERLAVCEDYDLWLRLTRRHAIGLLHECLVEKFGGHADQLSKSQPAMDRFRVFVLLKLLCEDELSAPQRFAAANQLRLKAQVLAGGARRRGLPSAEFYVSIAAAAERLCDQEKAAANQLGTLHELQAALLKLL